MKRLAKGRTSIVFAAVLCVAASTYTLFADKDLTGETPEEQRRRMVEEQLERRGIQDAAVLQAMANTPRHLFVSGSLQAVAYGDHSLHIDAGQVLPPPYVIALVAELLQVKPDDKVLEVGTGSGYGAAVLARLAKDVHTIEILKPLGTRAARLFQALGYGNIHSKIGDGFYGWPEAAPFDKISVTAAAPVIPAPLLDQLKIGGRMVVAVGDRYQHLTLITKESDSQFTHRKILPIRFVPMTGEVVSGRPRERETP